MLPPQDTIWCDFWRDGARVIGHLHRFNLPFHHRASWCFYRHVLSAVSPRLCCVCCLLVCSPYLRDRNTKAQLLAFTQAGTDCFGHHRTVFYASIVNRDLTGATACITLLEQAYSAALIPIPEEFRRASRDIKLRDASGLSLSEILRSGPVVTQLTDHTLATADSAGLSAACKLLATLRCSAADLLLIVMRVTLACFLYWQ